MSIFKKVLSVGSGKLTTELNKIVEEINSRESSLEKLTDEEIKTGFLALSDKIDAVSYTHPPSPRDGLLSRMPSSA